MSSPPLCSVCDEIPSTLSCVECRSSYCSGPPNHCDEEIHKPQKMKTHRRNPINTMAKSSSSASPPSSSSTPLPLCDLCGVTISSVFCTNCSLSLCQNDSDELHQPKKMKSHNITQLVQPSPPVAMSVSVSSPSSTPSSPPPSSSPPAFCDLCDKNPVSVSCDDCSMEFCVSCDSDLHRPEKKKSHKRTQIGGNPNSNNPISNGNGGVFVNGNGVLSSSSNVSIASVPTGPPQCDLCEEAVATVYCSQCDMSLCMENNCDSDVHKRGKEKLHMRSKIDNPNAKSNTQTIASAAVAAPSPSVAKVPTVLSPPPSLSPSPSPSLSLSKPPAVTLISSSSPPLSSFNRPPTSSYLTSSPPSVTSTVAATTITPIVVTPPPSSSPSSLTPLSSVFTTPSVCGLCDDSPASVYCVECSLPLCDDSGNGCDKQIHKPLNKKNHKRNAIVAVAENQKIINNNIQSTPIMTNTSTNNVTTSTPTPTPAVIVATPSSATVPITTTATISSPSVSISTSSPSITSIPSTPALTPSSPITPPIVVKPNEPSQPIVISTPQRMKTIADTSVSPSLASSTPSIILSSVLPTSTPPTVVSPSSLSLSPTSVSSSPSSLCSVCDELPSTIFCSDCENSYCDDDDSAFHKPAKMANHKRNKIISNQNGNNDNRANNTVATADTPLSPTSPLPTTNTFPFVSNVSIQSSPVLSPPSLPSQEKSPLEAPAAIPIQRVMTIKPQTENTPPIVQPTAIDTKTSSSSSPSISLSSPLSIVSPPPSQPSVVKTMTISSALPSTTLSHAAVLAPTSPPSSSSSLPPPVIPSSFASPSLPLCSVCDDLLSTIQCAECDEYYCDEDDEAFHKPAKMANHTRKKVNGALSTPLVTTPTVVPSTVSPFPSASTSHPSIKRMETIKSIPPLLLPSETTTNQNVIPITSTSSSSLPLSVSSPSPSPFVSAASISLVETTKSSIHDDHNNDVEVQLDGDDESEKQKINKVNTTTVFSIPLTSQAVAAVPLQSSVEVSDRSSSRSPSLPSSSLLPPPSPKLKPSSPPSSHQRTPSQSPGNVRPSFDREESHPLSTRSGKNSSRIVDSNANVPKPHDSEWWEKEKEREREKQKREKEERDEKEKEKLHVRMWMEKKEKERNEEIRRQKEAQKSKEEEKKRRRMQTKGTTEIEGGPSSGTVNANGSDPSSSSRKGNPSVPPHYQSVKECVEEFLTTSGKDYFISKTEWKREKERKMKEKRERKKKRKESKPFDNDDDRYEDDFDDENDKDKEDNDDDDDDDEEDIYDSDDDDRLKEYDEIPKFSDDTIVFKILKLSPHFTPRAAAVLRMSISNGLIGGGGIGGGPGRRNSEMSGQPPFVLRSLVSDSIEEYYLLLDEVGRTRRKRMAKKRNEEKEREKERERERREAKKKFEMRNPNSSRRQNPTEEKERAVDEGNGGVFVVGVRRTFTMPQASASSSSPSSFLPKIFPSQSHSPPSSSPLQLNNFFSSSSPSPPSSHSSLSTSHSIVVDPIHLFVKSLHSGMEKEFQREREIKEREKRERRRDHFLHDSEMETENREFNGKGRGRRKKHNEYEIDDDINDNDDNDANGWGGEGGKVSASTAKFIENLRREAQWEAKIRKLSKMNQDNSSASDQHGVRMDNNRNRHQ